MLEIIPPEYAWLIPLAIPFLIGLIVGVVIKRTLKLIIILVVLILVLVAVGYTQLPAFDDIAKAASKYLPTLWEEAGPLINMIPYSSATFLLGLGIGLWKG
ncbi:MAG: hypothetical protein QXJ17_04785 [Nitrososphaeria archaeon]